MPKIGVTIECGKLHCDGCHLFDENLCLCAAWPDSEFVYDGATKSLRRLLECLSAELAELGE